MLGETKHKRTNKVVGYLIIKKWRWRDGNECHVSKMKVLENIGYQNKNKNMRLWKKAIGKQNEKNWSSCRNMKWDGENNELAFFLRIGGRTWGKEVKKG